MVTLPLQHRPRQLGRSIFVDDALEPAEDQWAALQGTDPVRAAELEALITRIEDGYGGLDALLGDPDGDARPWDAARARRPAALIVYALARLAAFANPAGPTSAPRSRRLPRPRPARCTRCRVSARRSPRRR